MITIENIQTVMGWSYPTALKFIERHGEKVNGKWMMKPDELGKVVEVNLNKAKKSYELYRMFA